MKRGVVIMRIFTIQNRTGLLYGWYSGSVRTVQSSCTNRTKALYKKDKNVDE